MNKALLQVIAVLSWLLLDTVGAAHAKVMRWDLHSVKFDDGGTASGRFLFDSDATLSKQLLSWDISIDAMSSGFLTAYRFNSAVEPMNGQVSGTSIVLESKILLDVDPIGRTAIIFQLDPQAPLTDVGGKVALGGFEACTYFCESRNIVAGEVISVPESSSGLVALQLLALAVVAQCSRLVKLPSAS